MYYIILKQIKSPGVERHEALVYSESAIHCIFISLFVFSSSSLFVVEAFLLSLQNVTNPFHLSFQEIFDSFRLIARETEIRRMSRMRLPIDRPLDRFST